MAKRRVIKSAEDAENQFEIDESIIDEVSDAEEFADVEITDEDVMDAVEAIDALADAVIEKANVEEKQIDADTLLDEVRDMIDDVHEEDDAEFEPEEEEELPEELTNSAVRVMVSEDGAINVEQTPDEIYNDTIDDMECTVFDTCDDVALDIEDTAEGAGDDVLVIGNSKTNKYKKGFVVLKSSANKKAWSAAYKKVKKMVGSSKLTAAHWVIVSALAKKEEENDKLKKKIECCLLKKIRSNKEQKAKFAKHFLKSDVDGQPTQPDLDPEGAPENETTPDQTAGTENGYREEGQVENAVSPEQIEPEDVTNKSGDSTEKLTADGVELPNEDIIVVDVPLTNNVKKIRMRKISSRALRGYNVYRVIGSSKEIDTLNGKAIKSGKFAYVFKKTSQGLFACVARFVPNGKGTYKPVLKNNKVVISRGKEHDVFSAAERVMVTKRIASARIAGRKEALKNAKRNVASRRPVTSAHDPMARRNGPALRRPVTSAARRPGATPVRKPVTSAARRPMRTSAVRRPVVSARRPVVGTPVRKPVTSAATRRAVMSQRVAENKEAKLRQMHETEERQRLFQNSQKQISEEKIQIKSSNTRNADTLNKMYNSMF